MGNPTNCPPWSEAHDAAVIALWPTTTRADIAARLGRTPRAVVVRARKLGLAASASLDSTQGAATRAETSLRGLLRVLEKRRRPLTQAVLENYLGRERGSLTSAVELGLETGALMRSGCCLARPGCTGAPEWVPLPWEHAARPVKGARVVRFGTGG